MDIETIRLKFYGDFYRISQYLLCPYISQSEEGEMQTVETLIKCIVIASGNDASVAMAEYIAGDEKTFVDMMNQRAQGLGMTNTHFEDCCGLTESKTHVTSARDIAIMSRELINHYPQIHNYSTIWMDTITHVTLNI